MLQQCEVDDYQERFKISRLLSQDSAADHVGVQTLIAVRVNQVITKGSSK